MRWNFVICILLCSTIIASPVNNGNKQKRSLSFLKSLLLSNLRVGRTQEKCTKTSQRKSSKENQILTRRRQKEEAVAVPDKNRDGKKTKQMRSKPKRVRNRENTSLTNFANDPNQAISTTPSMLNTTKTTTARTTTSEKSIEQKTKLQNFSGNRLIDNNESIVITIGDLNFDSTSYATPATCIMNELQYVNPMIGMPRKCSYVNPMIGMPRKYSYVNPMIGMPRKYSYVNPMIGMPRKYSYVNPMIGMPRKYSYVNPIIEMPRKYSYVNPMIGMPRKYSYENPMIRMPRKYSYEKRNDDTVQTYSLDNKSDVIVSETYNKHIPRPAYVGNTNKDLILNASPYVHEISPSTANQQYGDTIDQIISNVGQYTNQFYPAIANQQYQEAVIYPNMVFDQQHGNLGLKMLPNMYTGQPIIVMDESEITKTTTAFQENEINKMTEPNVKEEPRGDIPE